MNDVAERVNVAEGERRMVSLSDEQLEAVAQRAAAIVTETVYVEVGKATVRGALLLLGSIVVAALAWFGIAEKVIGGSK